jgi:hypothetical protein
MGIGGLSLTTLCAKLSRWTIPSISLMKNKSMAGAIIHQNSPFARVAPLIFRAVCRKTRPLLQAAQVGMAFSSHLS